MQAKAWASYELEKIAQEQAQEVIDSSVNISYDVVGDIPTWTIDKLLIKDYTTALQIIPSVPINAYGTYTFAGTGSVRFNGVIYDSNGTQGSVKKIYCHPIIYLYSNIRMSCLIFDNNPTPYTWETFKARVVSISNQIQDTARIVASGSYVSNEQLVTIASFDAYGGSGQLIMYGMKPDGSTSTLRFDELTPTNFFDGVNAIN